MYLICRSYDEFIIDSIMGTSDDFESPASLFLSKLTSESVGLKCFDECLPDCEEIEFQYEEAAVSRVLPVVEICHRYFVGKLNDIRLPLGR